MGQCQMKNIRWVYDTKLNCHTPLGLTFDIVKAFAKQYIIIEMVVNWCSSVVEYPKNFTYLEYKTILFYLSRIGTQRT